MNYSLAKLWSCSPAEFFSFITIKNPGNESVNRRQCRILSYAKGNGLKIKVRNGLTFAQERIVKNIINIIKYDNILSLN